MAKQERCQILEQQKIGPNHYKLTLFSKNIASTSLPGQFVNVKCSDSAFPLLRRPLSLHQINKKDNSIDLLYEVIGKGTELLKNYVKGEYLDVLGPLGTGFQVDPEKTIHILIGGGMGTAPLMALTNKLKEKKSAVYALLGFRNKELVILEKEYKKTTDQVLVSTDDGSYGKKGYISELLLALLNNALSGIHYPQAQIYACGPKVMLKTIAEIALQYKIACQISMEERMACGIGACKGCAVMTKSGFKMVCKDGPVFSSEEIVW